MTADGKKRLKVAAAMICDKERFLICQRPLNKARGLSWEFPGGKLEEGESGEEAIVREIMEELSIEIVPRILYTIVVHEYDDVIVELMVYRCTIENGIPVLREHRDLRWIDISSARLYEFCPADEKVISKLIKEGI